MSTTDWAVPGDLDTGTWYGEQFHAVHDRLLPRGEAAEETADFLMRLAGRTDPMVIELGVGTGRIGLPLARRGAAVTGVDSSPLMLDACRAAMGPADAGLRLVEADIRDWRPDRQAGLVYSVGATMTYLRTTQDQHRAMRVIASAVRPGGTVVIENHNPALIRLFHDHRRSVELKLPLVGAPDHADALSLLDEDEQVWQMEYRWTDADGVTGRAVERVLLTEPDDLIDLAAEVGLSWRATHADWTGGPARPHSSTYICVFSAPVISDAV